MQSGQTAPLVCFDTCLRQALPELLPWHINPHVNFCFSESFAVTASESSCKTFSGVNIACRVAVAEGGEGVDQPQSSSAPAITQQCG
jgi:hypothetical protein